jgi:hypothetical protein
MEEAALNPSTPEPLPKGDEVVSAAPQSESQEADEIDPKARALEAKILSLRQRSLNGANWFYWVAGLSVVNSLIVALGGQIQFVVGLGITLAVDALCFVIGQRNPDLAAVTKIFALGFAVFVALLVCGFGWLARRHYLVPFAIGMFLYLLDGLIFLFFQDWLPVAFHAFALYSMWLGFTASRELLRIERNLQQHPILEPE